MYSSYSGYCKESNSACGFREDFVAEMVGKFISETRGGRRGTLGDQQRDGEREQIS